MKVDASECPDQPNDWYDAVPECNANNPFVMGEICESVRILDFNHAFPRFRVRICSGNVTMAGRCLRDAEPRHVHRERPGLPHVRAVPKSASDQPAAAPAVSGSAPAASSSRTFASALASAASAAAHLQRRQLLPRVRLAGAGPGLVRRAERHLRRQPRLHVQPAAEPRRTGTEGRRSSRRCPGRARRLRGARHGRRPRVRVQRRAGRAGIARKRVRHPAFSLLFRQFWGIPSRLFFVRGLLRQEDRGQCRI